MEKQLGISGKKAIEEEVGVEEFTRLCRESVLTYVEEFERLTERIGYWTDMEHAYYTFHPSYVESVWWHLKQLFDNGLLYEDLKVVPVLPALRDGALVATSWASPTSTTTRSTRAPTCACASPTPTSATTSAARRTSPCGRRRPGRCCRTWRSRSTPRSTTASLTASSSPPSSSSRSLARARRRAPPFPGAALVGLHYERPFDDVRDARGCRRAVTSCAADYVTTEDGTGLVHQSPAFGEIDRQVARENGLPTLNPVGPDGTFTARGALARGRGTCATRTTTINDELERRGLLDAARRLHPLAAALLALRHRSHLLGQAELVRRHEPFKEQLIDENASGRLASEHIRDGRMGEWLDNNVDWALSRDRYWGTPLPIWRCEDGHLHCVGSRAELSALAGRDLSDVEPHRPGDRRGGRSPVRPAARRPAGSSR